MTKSPSLSFVVALLFSPFVLLADETPTPRAPANSVDFISVVTRAPALNATRARAEAARARRDASGRFPDPEVEGMLSQRKTPEENMPMYELNIRQPLPKAGERAADRERAAAVVTMAESEFAVMAGEMASETAMAITEAETAQRRAQTRALQIKRTEQVLAAIDARIGTGQSRIGERLALQTRIASMQLMVAEDERMAADALSEARGRLGLAADAPLPDFFAPAASEINPDQAPALATAQAKVAEARAMARMARASAKPMTAVGLRLERERERMGNNDTIGIAFMTEIPWRSRTYARAEERAAQAEANAALAEATASRHLIIATLSRVERAQRLAALARRLAEETQKRLGADYESLVRSAGTGGMGTESTVLMLLEVLEKDTDAQLQVVEAEGAVRSAQAELWRYAPPHFFPTL